MPDLAQFLRDHPVTVDLRVLSWQAEDDYSCELKLAANPWWRPSTERAVTDVEFTIRCTGVRSTHITSSDWTIEDEDLLVLQDAPEVWACGTHATVFGNAPLRDPARFFVEWWDRVHELHAEDVAELHENFVPFTAWAERVSQHESYTLLRGPQRLLEEALPLLDAQGVHYALVSGPERPTTELQLVVFGPSWLVCQSATIDVR